MGLILSNSPEPAQQDLSLVPRRKQWHQLGVFSHPCLRAEALGATGMRLPEAMLLEEHRCAKGRGRRAARRCAQQLVSALCCWLCSRLWCSSQQPTVQRDRREREWQGLAAVDRLDGCSMTGKLWSVLIGVSGSHLSIRKCTTRHKA